VYQNFSLLKPNPLHIQSQTIDHYKTGTLSEVSLVFLPLPPGKISQYHNAYAFLPSLSLAMDCEPEELQFLSLLGIYRESAKLIHSWRSLFARIAVSLVLPLSFLFLLHIQISYYLFSSIDSDDSALDRAAPDSAAENRILQRLASDWMKLMIFKGVYLVALLVLAMLSTAAAVYSVASIYSAKELSFSRVLSVVPKVWHT
jgi:hypothetical protein